MAKNNKNQITIDISNLDMWRLEGLEDAMRWICCQDPQNKVNMHAIDLVRDRMDEIEDVPGAADPA